MDFSLSSEQHMLKDNLRRYMDANIAPLVAECEKREEFAWDVLPGLAQFGCVGGPLSEAGGGLEMSYSDFALVMEEAGYQWLSLRVVLNTINIVGMLLDRFGTEDQKQRYLKPLLASEKKTWVAITEPNHGSNVAGLECRAVQDGDSYVINGSKLWITNGIWGDFGILVAKTHSATCDGKLSLFIIDREECDFHTERVKTMFVRSTATSALTFDDTVIPKENLLGQEGEGLRAILTGLNFGRLNVSMGAVGAAQAALDLSTEYAKTRKQFGRPIGSFQLVQRLIVDMTVRTEAARMLGYRAACDLDSGAPSRTACSIAKLYAAEAAHEVASMALQVHGGMGYSTDYPIERIFRDTRGALIPEGTSEIQTLLIGREILGMSAFL
ncbi:MAG: acyl-CoA dehydrogenase family protein [Jhaorihella sp.]